jgi:hypothetical protein
VDGRRRRTSWRVSASPGPRAPRASTVPPMRASLASSLVSGTMRTAMSRPFMGESYAGRRRAATFRRSDGVAGALLALACIPPAEQDGRAALRGSGAVLPVRCAVAPARGLRSRAAVPRSRFARRRIRSVVRSTRARVPSIRLAAHGAGRLSDAPGARADASGRLSDQRGQMPDRSGWPRMEPVGCPTHPVRASTHPVGCPIDPGKCPIDPVGRAWSRLAVRRTRIA